MSTVKLERDGKVIVRTKTDYEYNITRYETRGFKLVSDAPEKKKAEPVAEKPKAKPKKKAK